MIGALTYYTDAGHGWIAVPIKELQALGIADKVTPYSYRKGDTAYLEEDCDAALLMETLEARGEKPMLIEHSTNGNSPIRNYSRFDASLFR